MPTNKTAEEYIRSLYGNDGSLVSLDDGAAGTGLDDGLVGDAVVLPQPKATPMGVVVNGVNDGRYVQPQKKVRTGMDELESLVGADSLALSPEEEQRRLKRMQTAAMIGNLGNVMGAFANLYYTGKGAPSQKVPDAVVPPYMQFTNMVSQARKNALTQKLAVEKMKEDREDKSLELRLKQLEMDMKRPVYEAQARSYDALVLQRQAAAAYNEARIAIQQGNYELAQRKIEEAERHNRAVEAIQGMNASTNAARVYNSTLPEYVETTVDKGVLGKETKTVKKTKGQDGAAAAQVAQTPPSKQKQRKAPPSRQR